MLKLSSSNIFTPILNGSFWGHTVVVKVNSFTMELCLVTYWHSISDSRGCGVNPKKKKEEQILIELKGFTLTVGEILEGNLNLEGIREEIFMINAQR